MAKTLANYITQVRQLLHDLNGNFWTDAQLTGYINEARDRLVRDTGCLRKIQTGSTAAAVETYPYASTLPQGNVTFDVININLYWGNTRIPLYYLPWTNFNAQLRFWQNYQGRPVAFSIYGTDQFYLGPVPDQTYTVECDTVIAPTPLVNATDADTINDVWTGPVSFYAARQAKFFEQSYGEAEIFMQKYSEQVQNVLATTYTRRMYTPYVNRS